MLRKCLSIRNKSSMLNMLLMSCTFLVNKIFAVSFDEVIKKF